MPAKKRFDAAMTDERLIASFKAAGEFKAALAQKTDHIVDPAEPTEIPKPPIVQYVMADGVTIRPAIIVAWELAAGRLKFNLQVFVDGQFDDAKVRGAHANATLQDWKIGVPYDGGTPDLQTGENFYAPGTWHY
jgi:hypothetical protein